MTESGGRDGGGGRDVGRGGGNWGRRGGGIGWGRWSE